MQCVTDSRSIAARRVRRAAGLAFALAGVLLAACAPVKPRSEVRASAAPVQVAPVPVEQDLLLQMLAAQFALHADDIPSAARGFAGAAELSGDVRLAEEATRLALAARDWSLASQAVARWQQLAPAAPGVQQARGWIALGEGRADAAHAALSELVARGESQAWRLVAQALMNASDKALAARVLRRLATPERLATAESNWVAASQLAFKLDDKAFARELADAAVSRFHGADAYSWSARLALDSGDKAAAGATYAESLQRQPGSLRLRGGYAALLAEQGDNAAAARVLATGAQDDTTYAARAAYAARAEDHKALAALYREVQADDSARSGKRQYLLGQVAEMLDRREEALAWYRGITIDDEHGFDAQMRASVVLGDLGRTDEAVAQLRRLAEASAGDRLRQRSAWLLEADLLANAKRPREALAVYDRALAAQPDDTRLLYSRALFAVEQGDMAAGERDLRRVLALSPDDAEAMNALGYTLADHSKPGDPRLGEALQLVQRALELKPDEAAIIDSMGWVRYRMGDLEASLADLRRAHAKQPDAEIAAHLGEVLWVKGERAEARRVWDEARRKDPDNRTLLEAIERLAST